MKKSCIILLITCVTVLLFSACGKEEREVYYDIESTAEQVFQGELPKGDLLCLCTQIFKEEPIQLWAERVKDENLQTSLKIYLRKTNGSMEALLENIDVMYRVSGWYMDKNGDFYIPQSDGIVKMDYTGKLVYENKDGMLVRDICELDDGTIILSVLDNNIKKLVKMKGATGEITKLENILLWENGFSLGTGKDGLYLLDTRGLWKVNLQEQTKSCEIAFNGMAYSLDEINAGVMDFKVYEGESVLILRGGGIEETLKLVNVSQEKTVIKIRLSDKALWTWFFNQIVDFNRENETYYVVLEQCGEEEDVWDFRTRTGVQLATGKGADIIMGSAVLGDVYSYLEKGVFEDLTPYMELSGIREEDYFPMTFDCWKEQDKIYGVQPLIFMQGGFAVEASVFDGNSTSDMEDVLETLLTYSNKAILKKNYNSEKLLEYFLEGSENLWGSIDWVNSTCDFEGDLFLKILNVSKKYGDKGEKDIVELAVYRNCSNLYWHDMKEELEADGKIVLDYFFDDGNHACIVNNFVMAINASSEHKDGAWEFLNFLLDQEAQLEVDYNNHYPSSRKAFYAMAQKEMEEGALIEKVNPSNGNITKTIKGCTGEERNYYREIGLSTEEIAELFRVTPERVREIVDTIEQAKPFPVRVEPILDIICEEAQAYFDDLKSAEEVIKVIENRVQLYLQENS